MQSAIIWKKAIVGGALLFLSGLTFYCPCERLLCCHLGTFWLGLSLALAVIFYENGFRAIDKSCWAPVATAATAV